MNLPPHCRIKSGSVYYVRKIQGRVHWIRLCRATDGELAARQAYQELMHPTPRTLADVMRAWAAEDHELAPKTLREYRRQVESVLIPVFGKMRPNELRSYHVAQFLETRGGVKANRERAALSSIFEWAMRRGLADSNPCRGVRRNKERPRRRYVTDSELREAIEVATPAFGAFLAAAYLTGLRQGDLRALTTSNLTPEGIKLTEQKRERQILIQWSDPLRKLVRQELERSNCNYVFTNTLGQPWKEWSLQSAMRKTKMRAGADWTLHDLRAKAESDSKEGMGLMASYQRARKISPVL